MRPPRALYLRYPFGHPMGEAFATAQQRTILTDALRALETLRAARRDRGAGLSMEAASVRVSRAGRGDSAWPSPRWRSSSVGRALDARALLEGALAWITGLGPWGPVMFVLLYVVATVLLLPAVVLTLGAGAVFGVGLGLRDRLDRRHARRHRRLPGGALPGARLGGAARGGQPAPRRHRRGGGPRGLEDRGAHAAVARVSLRAAQLRLRAHPRAAARLRRWPRGSA